MLKIVLVLAILVIALIYLLRKLRFDLHMLQLNSYRNERYWCWLRVNPGRNLRLLEFIPLLLASLHGVLGELGFLLFWLLPYGLSLWRGDRQGREKKPLVITARVKRLGVIYLGLILLPLGSCFTVGLSQQLPLYFPFTVLAIVIIASPIGLILANILAAPLEAWIANRYRNDAQRIIRSMPRLKIIGITGSYGKTSTKFYLHSLLSEHLHTLMSPASFNTPMGLTRTVREYLRPTHQVFIAEMGAKQSGDIAELCELVHPQMGIITAIGEQHLETFGSIEKVKQTKTELFRALPRDGIAFYNGDDPMLQDSPTALDCHTISFGIHTEGLDYRAIDISVDTRGTRFTVLTPRGEQGEFQTRLLGEHNIYNLMASIAVCHQMGIAMDKLSLPVRSIVPAPHRLELKRSPAGITILDDAFSANPVGSRMALEVLAAMDCNKRIMITPGMIELGGKEYEHNKRFGEQAAAACDYVILVGPERTRPILDGLREAGYPQEQIHVATDLFAANAHMQTIAVAGDIVLYENDLPDNY